MEQSHKFDEHTLSAYIDGELDIAAMHEVDRYLEKDAAARQYVLDATRTAALLRTSAKNVLHEEIPQRLLAVLAPQRSTRSRPGSRVPAMLRVAAFLIMGILGFGSGILLERKTVDPVPALFAPLPARYSDVVNAALENNLSGIPRLWQEPDAAVVLTVTPVKTYRDKNGVFYREYKMEVVSGKGSSRINGLAYRTLKGSWETKALFF